MSYIFECEWVLIVVYVVGISVGVLGEERSVFILVLGRDREGLVL